MNWLKFHLERLLLRGSHYRLLGMAVAVVFVAVFGGLALLLLGEPESGGQAVWWAFLRLTDPGYLGDDVGAGRRIVSTLVTVAGYVLFMGALIAILTQWLHETVERLQRGETPIVAQDHVLVLGYSERSADVLRELLRSQKRVKRALLSSERARLQLVVLVEHLDEDVRAGLAESLGELWDDRAVILRSGSPLVPAHLERVDLTRAAAILIPSDGEQDEETGQRDALTIKTVMSIASHPDIIESGSPPRIVAEVRDHRLTEIVGASYPGVLELLPGDTIVSRLIAQNLRHLGLSWIIGELLAFNQGNELFYPEFPELVGASFTQVVGRIDGGVPLGVVRMQEGEWVSLLNPGPAFRVEEGDRIVVVAEDATVVAVGPDAEPTPVEPLEVPSVIKARRVLVLGWNRRVPPLLAELDTYSGEQFTLDIMSRVSVEERNRQLAAAGVSPDATIVRHVTGDYTNVGDVRALDIPSYDNVLVLGRAAAEDGESADAQTILCYAIVQAMLPKERRPSVLIELMDPANVTLFDERPGELVLSPVLMAHMLAHVAVRPELYAVVTELFTEGGAELLYRDVADYGLVGRELSFGELQQMGTARGEVVAGVRVSRIDLDIRGDLILAPNKSERFSFDDKSRLLVLATVRPRT